MRASELNSGMNVIEIIDEYFQTMRTFCPDHENIIDIHTFNKSGRYLEFSINDVIRGKIIQAGQNGYQR